MSPNLLALLPLLWALPANANECPPNHFTIHYEVQARGISAGDAVWQVQPLGNGEHLFRVELNSRGLAGFFYPLTTTSESRWEYAEGCAVRPLHFEYNHSRRANRHLRIAFDWPQQQAEIHFRGTTRNEPLHPGSYDNQLYLLTLGQLAAQGEQTITFETIGQKGPRQRTAEVIGKAQLNAHPKRLETLQLHYQDDDKSTTLWYAQTPHWLPIMLEYQSEESGLVRLLATTITLPEQPPQRLQIRP